MEKESFSKLGKYYAAKARVEQACWDSDGNIILVESNVNYEKAYTYFGLILLDGKKLSIKKHLPELPSVVCKSYSVHKLLLIGTQLLLHTDKIHFLDAKTWDYQTSLSYPIDNSDKISIHPNNQYIAIGIYTPESDAIIIDLKTNQKWSLKNQVELS